MIQTRIRKRDNRRVYDVRLRDADGREYSKTFLTKREAEAFESAERTARNRGVWIDPRLASVRVIDVAGVWLTANTTKRPGSIARDQSILENHILPAFWDPDQSARSQEPMCSSSLMVGPRPTRRPQRCGCTRSCGQ